MPVQIDHIAVAAHDKHESARFYSETFGLAEPEPVGVFLAVHLEGAFTLHFAEPGIAFPGQHYAFRVDDRTFDAVRARLDARGTTYRPHHGRGTPGGRSTTSTAVAGRTSTIPRGTTSRSARTATTEG